MSDNDPLWKQYAKARDALDLFVGESTDYQRGEFERRSSRFFAVRNEQLNLRKKIAEANETVVKTENERNVWLKLLALALLILSIVSAFFGRPTQVDLLWFPVLAAPMFLTMQMEIVADRSRALNYEQLDVTLGLLLAEIGIDGHIDSEIEFWRLKGSSYNDASDDERASVERFYYSLHKRILRGIGMDVSKLPSVLIGDW